VIGVERHRRPIVLIEKIEQDVIVRIDHAGCDHTLGVDHGRADRVRESRAHGHGIDTGDRVAFDQHGTGERRIGRHDHADQEDVVRCADHDRRRVRRRRIRRSVTSKWAIWRISRRIAACGDEHQHGPESEAHYWQR